MMMAVNPAVAAVAGMATDTPMFFVVFPELVSGCLSPGEAGEAALPTP
jgi:hypothetical protein